MSLLYRPVNRKNPQQGVSMHSNGADTPDEATAGQITDIVPHFVFGKNLRDRIRKCKVERETPKP